MSCELIPRSYEESMLDQLMDEVSTLEHSIKELTYSIMNKYCFLTKEEQEEEEEYWDYYWNVVATDYDDLYETF